MLSFIIGIAGILLTIFFVIGTHEFAHFLAARLLKVKVLRFSIGFGQTLYRTRDKQGTEYVLSLIPLGGYVKMLDETEENVSPNDLPYAFNRQPFYKKFIIVAAGPIMNILCAFALYWLIFVIGFVTIKPIVGEIKPHSIAAQSGLLPQQQVISIDDHKILDWTNLVFRLILHAGNQDHATIQTENLTNKTISTHVLDLSDWHLSGLTPDPLGSLGIKPYIPDIPLVIGVIAPKSPAAASSLKVGDKIVALNGKPIKDWEALITIISKNPNNTFMFKVERKGQMITLPVTLGYQRDLLLNKSGYLGIGPHFTWPDSLLQKVQYGPLTAITHAFNEIVNFTYFNLLLFGKLITGKLSLQSLGGPITIFETAGEALNSGFTAFIGFLAFLSISIGIINFFPIPGLDGGHLFIYTIEFIIQRPLPNYVLNVLYRLGLLLIVFFLLQALINDILRLY